MNFGNQRNLRSTRRKQVVEKLPELPTTADMLDRLCQWTAVSSVTTSGPWCNAAGDVWHWLNDLRDTLEATL